MLAIYALAIATCGIAACDARRLRRQAHLSAASDSSTWPCVVFHKLSRELSELPAKKLASMDKFTVWFKTSTRNFCVLPSNGPSKVDILWMDGSTRKGHIQLTEISAVPQNECRGHEQCIIFKGTDPTRGGKPVAVKAWPLVDEGNDAVRRLADAIDFSGSKGLIKGSLKIDILLSGFYTLSYTQCADSEHLYHNGNEIEGAAATELLNSHADTHINDVVLMVLQKLSGLKDEVDKELLKQLSSHYQVSLQNTRTSLNLRMAALTAALANPDDTTACQGIFNVYIKQSTRSVTFSTVSSAVNVNEAIAPNSAAQFCGPNNQKTREAIVKDLYLTFVYYYKRCPMGSAMGTFLSSA